MYMFSTVANPSNEGIRKFLMELDRLDPLTLPGDWFVPGMADVAAMTDANQQIVAMGWLLPRLGGLEIDIRVRPTHRGQGLGAKLFDHLAPQKTPLIAACVAGHDMARQFLETRDFLLAGVAFEQRWDGEPQDVPRAFETAQIFDAETRDEAWTVFRKGMADGWPPPPFDERSFHCVETRVQIARVADEVVGVLASRFSHGTWNIGGIGVLPQARNHGVGRALLCGEMRWAAREGFGVSMQVGSDEHRVLEWARNLGFWSVRTQTYYKRD